MKAKELIDIIEQQASLISFNRSLLIDLGIFYNGNLNENEKQVIQGNLFFEKMAYLLEREIILNYSYLFSDSDNDFFRLPKVTRAIIRMYKKLTWIEPVALDKIENYSQRIQAVINSDKIKTIRDKAIAHRESNWETKIPDLDYRSLQELNALLYSPFFRPLLSLL